VKVIKNRRVGTKPQALKSKSGTLLFQRHACTARWSAVQKHPGGSSQSCTAI